MLTAPVGLSEAPLFGLWGIRENEFVSYLLSAYPPEIYLMQ